jgi:hypothetical protein
MASDLAGQFHVLEDWKQIVSDFKDESTKCDVLLLIPHVDRTLEGDPLLDLGVEPSMRINQIRGALELRRDEPLVFLLGCSTGAGETPSTEFPGRFLDAGAALVVSTMTAVRGRFVAPLGEQLVHLTRELAGSDEPLFGEAMLRLRQLLLGQNPMVLTLVAYGDADWLLSMDDNDEHDAGGGTS